MNLSKANRVLILGGIILSILGFALILMNFSQLGSEVTDFSSLEPGQDIGADFFSKHIGGMALFAIGGLMLTIGIIRALIAKFGDGKVIDKALKTVGGEKHYTTTNNIHKETVNGNRFGDVSGSRISIDNSAVPKSRSGKIDFSGGLLEELHGFVSQNKIEDCLEKLVDHFADNGNAKALGESTLLMRRHNELEETIRGNTASREDISVEKERITNAVIGLINQELVKTQNSYN